MPGRTLRPDDGPGEPHERSAFGELLEELHRTLLGLPVPDEGEPMRWKSRLAFRKVLLARAKRQEKRAQRRLERARKRDIHPRRQYLTRVRAAMEKVDLRKTQVGEARFHVEKQKTLRERAWDQMQALIDAKVTEHGGNNHGAEVEKIIRANGGVPGEPWCGDTVAVCYLRAGAKSVLRAWASVSWLNRLLSRVLRPRRGHVVTYKFDHTGLFDRWAPELGAGWFYAGEGNTGNSGAASDSVTGGDGVKLKQRHVSQVAAFRRVRN